MQRHLEALAASLPGDAPATLGSSPAIVVSSEAIGGHLFELLKHMDRGGAGSEAEALLWCTVALA